jgi:hypothetical protein
MTARFDRLYRQIMAELKQSVVDPIPEPSLKVAVLTIGSYDVHIYFHDSEVEGLLFEAQHRGKPIGGIYSAIKHPAHTPNGQQHLHLYAKNNQIGSLNIDGSTHDSWHGHPLPQAVIDGIRQHFPKFTIPASGILEAASPEIGDFILLLEMTR